LIEPKPSRIHYISPSLLPSRSANSVHVISQARALADVGADVTLYACRTVADPEGLPAAIRAQYGIDTDGIRLVTSFVRSGRGASARITVLAIRRLLSERRPYGLIISRNLYAAFLVGALGRRPLVFEVHEVENGVRGWLQRSILRRSGVRIVTISRKLLEILVETHKINPAVSQVLHDAAPAGIAPVPAQDRRARLTAIVPAAQGSWRGVCGYFGHLYPGRGIEILESMAMRQPDVLFLIVGGHQQDIDRRRALNTLPNIIFLGYLPHHRALDCAKCVDVLLMPYQSSVSIGVPGRDIGRFLSPMKMFEYMATGVPLISSDLPVLREVLRDNETALLVKSTDVSEWVTAVDRLLGDAALSCRLASNARSDYLTNYTWEHRARALLAGPEMQPCTESSCAYDAYFEYLKSRSTLSRMYRRVILYPLLCRHLKGRTLDIGCGVGDMLAFRPNTVGTDVNPKTVAYCMERGLAAFTMEANRLPFRDHEFDSAVLDNVLEHVSDPRPLLREAARILKPAGVLLVGVPGERGYASDADHKVFYDEQALTSAVDAAGFRRMRLFHLPWRSRGLSKRVRQYCIYGVFSRQ
jgi:SAM-dependent methyltransferase